MRPVRGQSPVMAGMAWRLRPIAGRSDDRLAGAAMSGDCPRTWLEGP
jgi:hypothetical protein